MTDDYTAAAAMREQAVLNRQRGQLAKPHASILTLWTDDEIELVTSMWMAGKSAGVIARALTTDEVHRTRNSVIGKVNRLGLFRNPGTKLETLPGYQPKAEPKPRAKLPGRPKKREPHNPAPILAEPVLEPPKPVVPPPKPKRTVRMLLWDAPADACRWPEWGFGRNETRFVCGEPIKPGKPYCHTHCEVAYDTIPLQTAKKIWRPARAT